MADPIHHEISIASSPERVFAALTESSRFAEFSAATAEIDASPGGAFSCFGGMIHGRIIEITPATRLVQAWRVANWAPGVYSIVRFELHKTGDGETSLVFDHDGFPGEDREHLDQGWQERYWAPLKACLEA